MVVDTETVGLLPFHNHAPFGVSLCDERGDSDWVDWPVDPFTRRVIGPSDDDFRFLQGLFGDPEIPKLFWNAKFDIRMLEHNFGFKFRGPIHDAYLAARVCNTLELNYKLKFLAFKYAGYPNTDEKDLQKQVIRDRNRAKKLGWMIATKENVLSDSKNSPVNADYWIPKALDPANRLCETYAVKDVERTLILWLMYWQILQSDRHFMDAYRTEMQVFNPILKMENRGVYFDPGANQEELDAINLRLLTQQRLLQKMVRDELGWKGEFNPASPDQLQTVLFEKAPTGYGLQPIKRTKKGWSTDWETLEHYVQHHFVWALIQFRGARQGLELFHEKYRRLAVVKPDGLQFLHPTFNQNDTRTHRLSCTTPNMQQASNPESTAKPFNFVRARKPLGPRPGYWWYKLDYAQQEARIFADRAQCKRIIETALAGADINNFVTNMVWGGEGNELGYQAMAYSMELGQDTPSEKVTALWKQVGWSSKHARREGAKSKAALTIAAAWLAAYDYDVVKAEKAYGKNGIRTQGKNLQYAKIYGAGKAKLAKMLRTSVDMAIKANAKFEEVFPEIPAAMRETTQQVRRDGYVINAYGRKLNVDRQKAYKGLNYYVQGTASDMMKRSIIRIDELFETCGLDAHLILTVHDELDFEVRIEHAKKWLIRRVARIMEDTEGRLNIPMVVEVGRIRSTWESKEDVKWLE